MDLLERKVDVFFEDLASKFLNSLLGLLDAIIAILCIVAVGYIIFYCIKVMFLREETQIQRILLGYFAFISLRIFSAIVKVAIFK